MIIYKCDKCGEEIPKDKIVSIMKLWQTSRYSTANLQNPLQQAQAQKVEGVEKEEGIFCPKCADEIWKQTKKL